MIGSRDKRLIQLYIVVNRYLIFLLQMTPASVVRLNRAVALRQVAGPEVALAEVEELARDLDGYHIFHAIRGELPVGLGRREQGEQPSCGRWN